MIGFYCISVAKRGWFDMSDTKIREGVTDYIQEQESIANKYVMRCMAVTMLVYTITVVLNLLRIFVIDQSLMFQAYIPSLAIYLILCFVTKCVPMSSKNMKYIILFGVILFSTVSGVFLTYHVVIISFLPFLYATLYSSKKVMIYVYVLTIFSTTIMIIILKITSITLIFRHPFPSPIPLRKYSKNQIFT